MDTAAAGGRNRARTRGGVWVASALVAGGALLAACGGSSGTPPATASSAPGTTGPGRASTSTTTSTSTSTTPATTSTTAPTTTTLPSAVPVSGTRAGGSFGALGAVRRVPVVAVRDGALSPPSAAAGVPVPPRGAVEIAFRQFGSGPDLLLVEGEHATLTWWDPRLLSDLAQHYTVTVFDYPGTGFSGPDPSATSVAAVADLAAGLSAALGLASPTVLGWGLGGQVALALAERHPGLAGRLVLVDSAAGGPAATRPSASVAAAMASSTDTDVQLAPLMFPPTLTAAIDGWLGSVAKVPRDDLVAAAVHEQAAIQASAWSDAALAAGLSALTAPTLVVVGSLDEVFPPANDVVLIAGLRHARDLLLPGAGYASMFQDEPQFVAALETFTG